MAYAGNNLSLVVEGIGGTSPNIWTYNSADTFATVKAANFITDAVARGMKVRDIVFIHDTATPATTIANILTVPAAGATMSQTGVVIAE